MISLVITELFLHLYIFLLPQVAFAVNGTGNHDMYQEVHCLYYRSPYQKTVNFLILCFHFIYCKCQFLWKPNVSNNLVETKWYTPFHINIFIKVAYAMKNVTLLIFFPLCPSVSYFLFHILFGLMKPKSCIFQL